MKEIIKMKKEIVELRQLMAEKGIDAYYVPSGDFHSSEYVNDYFKARAFMTNLTGESGELIVTQDGAWVWTDGRYFLQAEEQLAGTEIELMRMAEPGVPTVEEFMTELVRKHNGTQADKKFVLGFDGRVVPGSFDATAKEIFGGFDNVVIKWDEDLVDTVWKDRPELKPTEIYELPLTSAGISAEDKIAAVRAEMKKEGTDYLLITDLMESAWLFNLRAADILYTPVFFAYTILTQDSVRLYVMDGALKNGLPQHLDFVEVHDYNDIYKDVAELSADKTLWLDSGSVNYALYLSIPEGMKLHDALTPVALMKVIKNETEIASSRKAHIKDGVAVTKLIKWLKDTVDKETLTEIGVADKLKAFRFEQEGCFDLSFATISGYGPHGAIIHYEPTPETDIEVEPDGFLLLDSGAQFTDGTTDITRTIAVGPLTQEMIDDYTYVLKSHIDVSLCKITPDMTGVDFDAVARKPLREVGLDFKHGLSHGVGHVLGVHEGPNILRRVPTPIEIKAGMIMSNEPGVYIDGKFGVRIENLILFKDDGEGHVVNEPLTCVPYERCAINVSLPSDEELEWLNNYSKWVRDTLVPLLDDATAEFVKEETEPFTR